MDELEYCRSEPQMAGFTWGSRREGPARAISSGVFVLGYIGKAVTAALGAVSVYRAIYVARSASLRSRAESTVVMITVCNNTGNAKILPTAPPCTAVLFN